MSSSTQSDAIAIPRRAVRGIVWAIVFLVGLVILAFIVLQIVRSVSPADPVAAGINTNDYQAVFLTNGQVYFGKMTAPGGGFYYIRNVYYLTSPPGNKSNQTLAKLTNDVHGPEDLVIVNRNQIVYVENLNPKGRAAQIIARGSP